jgi:hypothetical protein
VQAQTAVKTSLLKTQEVSQEKLSIKQVMKPFLMSIILEGDKLPAQLHLKRCFSDQKPESEKIIMSKYNLWDTRPSSTTVIIY